MSREILLCPRALIQKLFINNSACSARLSNLERQNIQNLPTGERFVEIEICARNV